MTVSGDWRVAADTRCRLGEGPHFVAARNCLLWVDILGRRLHRLDLGDSKMTVWDMPEPICWVVDRADGDGFMAGFASGMARLALAPLTIGPIIPLGPQRVGHRLNDAKVDPAGRLWAGVMQEAGATPTGTLHRIDGSGLAVADSGYLVPNGPAFSPDGAFLYHADSPRRLIYRFAMAADGSLQDRRVHIEFHDHWGVPDGMTVDAQGYLWVAHWDGGCVSRFDPDGRRERAIALPASRITSLCFAGAGLDRLFVTSAAHERDGEALAGALFEIDAGVTGVTGVTGLAPTAFAGLLPPAPAPSPQQPAP